MFKDFKKLCVKVHEELDNLKIDCNLYVTIALYIHLKYKKKFHW